MPTSDAVCENGVDFSPVGQAYLCELTALCWNTGKRILKNNFYSAKLSLSKNEEARFNKQCIPLLIL